MVAPPAAVLFPGEAKTVLDITLLQLHYALMLPSCFSSAAPVLHTEERLKVGYGESEQNGLRRSAYLIDEKGVIAHDVAVGTDAILELVSKNG